MMPNSFRRRLTKALSAMAIVPVLATLCGAASPGKKPNVLFIAVDDLRPELGCYGCAQIKSPNIDKLASRGMVFTRAYCQQAICMASRASLLSGYRPDKGRIYNCLSLHDDVPDALSLNKHFLANGYEAITLGKIYHHARDEQEGWSRPAWHPQGSWVGRGYLSPEAMKIAKRFDEEIKSRSEKKGKKGAAAAELRRGMGPAFEHPDVPDNAYPDGMIADRAIAELGRLKEKPFFLAVGFAKPHLPFNAPHRYWELYDHEKIALAKNPFTPLGSPKCALTNWEELRAYYGMPKKGNMPDDQARNLIHAYYACVSYVDAEIGRVLDELDRLGLSEHTIVVLWGDHGWKLGEHSMWCKHTNYEWDTHSALILRVPAMKAVGRRTKALTEFVDIYPTLCELCGLELPSHLEGTSMAPLLDDPDRRWKKAVFSQYPHTNPLAAKTMGYSMRTDRYRYTEWQDIETGKVAERELFDHQTDPDENKNIAADPENRELVERLDHMLRQGYKAARP